MQYIPGGDLLHYPENAPIMATPTNEGGKQMLWYVTHWETIERPSGAIQQIHLEADDGIALVLERPAIFDEIKKADLSALALEQYGVTIDPNNID
jgi:hypothetical protein